MFTGVKLIDGGIAFELNFLLYKTNRFHFAVRLFSFRSQKTSKCGKNISDPLAKLVTRFPELVTRFLALGTG